MNLRNIILVSMFIVNLFGTQAHAAPNKDELATIRAKIERLREQNKAAEASRNQAADALQQSERAISEANRALSALEQQRSATALNLSQLHARSLSVQVAISHQQQALMDLIRQQYFSGQADTARLFMNGDNPNQLTRNLTYYSYLSHARNQLISSLQQNLYDLVTLTQTQQQQQTHLDQIHNQHEQQRLNLQAQRKIKQEVVKNLGAEIQQQREELVTLQQNEKRITRLMQDIAKAIAKKKAAQIAKAKELARARRALPPTPAHPSKPQAQPFTPKTGLGKLKGHLIMPTHGELIHRYGTPREQGGTLWKGLFFKAPAGQAVRVIADGQVVFADWLRGFGNLIIIDHGGGYMSLYSNNETLYKQVGSSVKAGDKIASVGNTGGNSETGLYFELRYQSQAFDPINWIAL